MEIEIIPHAKNRMSLYGISEDLARDAVENPDKITEGHNERKIAQKRLNGYVLRVVFEDKDSKKVIVTAYKAKSERYEI